MKTLKLSHQKLTEATSQTQKFLILNDVLNTLVQKD